mgnify:CR=1 FL=1
MSAKRIMFVVLGALAFVGGIALLILRQKRLAGLLRAAAEGALIQHDLRSLQHERAKLLDQDTTHQVEVISLNRMIEAKRAELITKPARLRGATEEQVDAELRAAGLLR